MCCQDPINRSDLNGDVAEYIYNQRKRGRLVCLTATLCLLANVHHLMPGDSRAVRSLEWEIVKQYDLDVLERGKEFVEGGANVLDGWTPL